VVLELVQVREGDLARHDRIITRHVSCRVARAVLELDLDVRLHPRDEQLDGVVFEGVFELGERLESGRVDVVTLSA
jgi:hypothetical protein